MTRDEALLWLNDRLGQTVVLDVSIHRGDHWIVALYGRGTLVGRPLGGGRDSLVGWYSVGGTGFDVTDEPTRIRLHGGVALNIDLGEGVRLSICEI